MANRTVKDAATVKGTNPQYLVEKIIRSKLNFIVFNGYFIIVALFTGQESMTASTGKKVVLR